MRLAASPVGEGGLVVLDDDAGDRTCSQEALEGRGRQRLRDRGLLHRHVQVHRSRLQVPDELPDLEQNQEWRFTALDTFTLFTSNSDLTLKHHLMSRCALRFRGDPPKNVFIIQMASSDKFP